MEQGVFVISYLLFFCAIYIVMLICAKFDITPPNDNFLIMLAILSGCEAIAWRIKK